MSADTALELRNLDISFGRRPAEGDAIEDRPFRLCVNRFTARGGELVGVAGRSGEGKSTLLHVLALLLDAPEKDAAGRGFGIVYRYARDGRQVSFSYPEMAASGTGVDLIRNQAFGFIFQQSFLLQHFSVLDNLALPQMLRPGYHRVQVGDKAERFLEDLQLPRKNWRSYPAELSGGQSQRVSVGRAMMHDPPFLFADEPTANLDNRLRSLVLKRLRACADAGACVILVSHELGDLARHCDRLVIVQGGGLKFPFTGDPDDNGPEAGRPALVPFAKRTEEDIRRITTELTTYIWESPTDSPRGVAALTAPKPADPPSSAAASRPDAVAAPGGEPPAGGRLGFRRHVWRFALTEIFGRKQRMMRAVVAFLLLSATAGFTFLSDLARGSVAFLRDTTLGPDEFINRMSVRNPNSENGGYLTDDQVRYCRDELPGLRTGPDGKRQAPTFIQQTSVRITEAGGAYDDKYLYSVPIGDDTLAPVAEADMKSAQIGVRYLKGDPFTADQEDCAAIMVTRRWLRKEYWRMPDWDKPVDKAPDPAPFPEAIEFQLDSDPIWNERPFRPKPPGLAGRVKVPLIGVFEYPPRVLRNMPSAPEAFLPEGFLRRLKGWKSHHPLLYPAGRKDGPPLTADYPLLTGFRIKVEKPKDAGWAKAPAVLERVRESFGGVNPEADADGSLVVKLSPSTNFNNRITKETFEKTEWLAVKTRRDEREGISDVVRQAAGAEPTIEYETASAASKFPSLPPLKENPPAFATALLRFATMRDVLPGQRTLREKFPKMETEVRYDRAIQIFEDVDGLVTKGIVILTVSFTAALLFLVGITAYMHIASKSGDIGILRAYGLSAYGIAWVYQVELAMFMLPSCLIGIILALSTAGVTNDWFAERMVRISAGKEGPADEPPIEAAAPGGARPAVFAHLRESLPEVAVESGTTLVWVALMLLPATVVAIGFIRRQSIVDCLRGAGA